MNLRIGDILHGFLLKDVRDLREIDSTGYWFEHVKTGAKLAYLANQDDNKNFVISFRTPPDDDTGLPHILEHSVLCGSRKYPLKEPMFELVKGSLYTFLNAFTASDRTMYPVASRNERDFVNLMDVYLDAVFYPNIHRDPLILRQEGWHYHLERREDEIRYNGVVYNEMKGAFSSPDQTLFRYVESSLFPDNCYGCESGGKPEAIPQLTQEQFRDFHRKYYHPSNSYIVFYGDGDIAAHLQFVDENYLRHFDRIEIDSAIRPQAPFAAPIRIEQAYPLSSEESEEGKTFFAQSYVLDKATDAESYLAFEILEYILLGTPSAPLKKALLNAGIAKDVFGVFSNSNLQTYLSIVAKYAGEDQGDHYAQIIRETLSRLVEDGLDPKLVEAAINKREFLLRESEVRSYPKGLLLTFKILDSWLYDSDPFVHVQYGATLQAIKEKASKRYFENLIRDHLLDNPHASMVALVPRKGLNEEAAAKLRAELREYQNSLTEAQLEEILAETAALKKKQTTPDTPEALASIPRLNLSDVNPLAEELPLVVDQLDGTTLLKHPVFTNRIAYLTLYFDSQTVPQDKLGYLALLSEVLAQVSTQRRDYSDLINEINLHTGGISFEVDALESPEDDSQYQPVFTVRGKALVSKFTQLTDLMSEILLETRFDEDFRLREILRQIKSEISAMLMSSGHSVAIRRLHSYHSPLYRYLERVSNVDMIRFLMDLERNTEERLPEIRENLLDVYRLVIRRPELRVSLACEDDDLTGLRPQLSGFLGKLEAVPVPRQDYVFDTVAGNEGFITPANIQYVVKGYNFRKLGYGFDGSISVLSNVIQLGFLLPNVRIQGGAYGAFCSFARNGISYFGSYRDPNLRETAAAFDRIPEFVDSLNLNERELVNYILGVISQQDMPLTPSQKSERAARNHLRGMTREMIQSQRDQIRGTKLDALRAFSPAIRKMMDKNLICVLGNEEKIRSCADMFDSLVNLFKE
jgi:presequence protease